MNLFDVILARKIEAKHGGGGGGESISPVTFTATAWNELPAINISEYFPASSLDFGIDIGLLEFSFNGITSSLPVTITDFGGYQEISGGLCTYITGGISAVISLTYKIAGWGVEYAFTNLPGSWTDITQAVQVGASDIQLTLFK